MDLSTTYLGMRLANPLMPGASPLGSDLGAVRRLEDAGASAIVLHSIFEEQIAAEQAASLRHIDAHAESYAEATGYFPRADEFAFGPDEYLERIHRIKTVTALPVVGSLNGATPGGWTTYARQIQDAGANALELNIYAPATDPAVSAEEIERRTLEIVRSVKHTIRIPVAVKLSPFYSSLPHLAKRLDAEAADGLILFNRFYQPDIDVEQLEAVRTLHLSDSSELLLRLRWLAILSGRVRASLACSGGVHTALDAIKAVMAGAHAVQLVAALLKRGPQHLRTVLDDMTAWMRDHEYESLTQMRGSMSLSHCPDPRAYERANYVHVLQSW